MMLTPDETAEKIVDIGISKTAYSFGKSFFLAVLAGVYIGIAAAGSGYAIHGVTPAGAAKIVMGALFTAGLMMIIVTGAELFTGNALVIVSCLAGENTWARYAKNLCVVFIGNFIGVLVILFLVWGSGQYSATGGLMGGWAITAAVSRTARTFFGGLCAGTLCGILVSAAVWMTASAKTVTGKIGACFFPVWLFVCSGYEHSIANMYFVPAGIIAKANPEFAAKALELGVRQSALDTLSWGRFLYGSLLPVAVGNLIGGALIVCLLLFLGFLQKERD
jgi:formate/nitrite transporter